jgi:hypothetical protein
MPALFSQGSRKASLILHNPSCVYSSRCAYDSGDLPLVSSHPRLLRAFKLTFFILSSIIKISMSKYIIFVLMLACWSDFIILCPYAFPDSCQADIGQVTRLTGEDRIWVADSRKALEKMRKNTSDKGKSGLIELIRSGEAFSVPRWTRVRITECPQFLDVAKIKILEGKYAGRSGWVLIVYLE